MTQLDALYDQLDKLQMTECSLATKIERMETKQEDNEDLADDVTFKNKLAILDEKFIQVTEAIESLEAQIIEIEKSCN